MNLLQIFFSLNNVKRQHNTPLLKSGFIYKRAIFFLHQTNMTF